MKIFGKQVSLGVLIGIFCAAAMAAYIPNAVTSATNKLRIEAGLFSCAASGSAITSQTGSWMTSITSTSTGVCTINHSGVWSAAPWCAVSSGDGTARLAMLNGVTTTTTIPVSHRNTSSNAQGDAAAVYIICIGPR